MHEFSSGRKFVRYRVNIALVFPIDYFPNPHDAICFGGSLHKKTVQVTYTWDCITLQ